MILAIDFKSDLLCDSEHHVGLALTSATPNWFPFLTLQSWTRLHYIGHHRHCGNVRRGLACTEYTSQPHQIINMVQRLVTDVSFFTFMQRVTVLHSVIATRDIIARYPQLRDFINE